MKDQYKDKKIKLHARVPYEEAQRFSKIQKDMGFKSPYQIMNYLCYCFLRVVDPENDVIQEEIPDEIRKMFSDLDSPKRPKRFFIKKENGIE